MILSVLTLLSVFSAATPVFAEDVNEYIADKEYTEKLLTEVVENNTEEKAPIVKEMNEKLENHNIGEEIDVIKIEGKIYLL